MKDLISEILNSYGISDSAESYGDGHINDTFLVGDGKYILQKINTDIFKDVDSLMSNIVRVTEFLREKIKKNGGDPRRETLNFIKTLNGDDYYIAKNGEAFRMYEFVDKVKSYNVVDEPLKLYNAAKAFGHFAMLLDDYPAEDLNETIVDFHNTPVRFKQLEEAIDKDPLKRCSEVKEEIEFAFKRKEEASLVVDAIKSGKVPIRVTHNDTKLNNVLLDEETGKGICVVDLDTVMPGSLLYDFGDALRFGASSGLEDETDLSKIWFDMNLYEAFAKGYLEETGTILTQWERKLLPFSAKLMTLECGVRFLTDYISGDIYFKIHKEKHNLDRARNQFKLVSDIEAKLPEMEKILAKY